LEEVDEILGSVPSPISLTERKDDTPLTETMKAKVTALVEQNENLATKKGTTIVSLVFCRPFFCEKRLTTFRKIVPWIRRPNYNTKNCSEEKNDRKIFERIKIPAKIYKSNPSTKT
jgi:hypothetical protein